MRIRNMILAAGLALIASSTLSQPNYPTRIVQDGVYYYCFTVDQSENLLNKISKVNYADSTIAAQDSLIDKLEQDISRADSVIFLQSEQMESDSVILAQTEGKLDNQKRLMELSEKQVEVLEGKNIKARRRTIFVGVLGGLFTAAAIIFE